MTTQARTPAGVPTGGQFAPSAHDEASASLAEDRRTVEERWAAVFDGRERAQLTRNGVPVSEWVDVVERLEADHGRADYQAIIDAHHLTLEPADTAEFLRLTGGKGPLTAAGIVHFDAERARSVPDSMLPVPPHLVGRIVDRRVDIEAVGEAWGHVPHTSPDDRFHAAYACVAEGIDQEVADATGSAGDWHRARMCRAEGLSDEDARRWAPLYPATVATLSNHGWSPDDLGLGPTVTEYPDAAKQANAWSMVGGVSKAQSEEWRAAGFGHASEARPFVHAGFSPAEAAQWRKVDLPANSASFLRAAVGAGITPAQAVAARDAGLALDDQAPAVIASMSPEEIGRWAREVGQGHTRASTINMWRETAGISDPGRVGEWRSASEGRAWRIGLNATTMRFINGHVDPSEVGEEHPIVMATAREFTIPVADARRQIDKAKDPISGARTMFRRRRLDPPF